MATAATDGAAPACLVDTARERSRPAPTFPEKPPTIADGRADPRPARPRRAGPHALAQGHPSRAAPGAPSPALPDGHRSARRPRHAPPSRPSCHGTGRSPATADFPRETADNRRRVSRRATGEPTSGSSTTRAPRMPLPLATDPRRPPAHLPGPTQRHRKRETGQVRAPRTSRHSRGVAGQIPSIPDQRPRSRRGAAERPAEHRPPSIHRDGVRPTIPSHGLGADDRRLDRDARGDLAPGGGRADPCARHRVKPKLAQPRGGRVAHGGSFWLAARELCGHSAGRVAALGTGRRS